MSKPDKIARQDKIEEVILLVAENYNKEINELTITLFTRVLEPYSIQEIEQAFFTWINSTDEQARFFPKTNDIIGIIRKHQDQTRQKLRLDQARLPLHEQTEEETQARVKMIREWRQKKLAGIIKTIDEQMPAINTAEKLRRQAQELLDAEQEDLDNQ